ncbi:MAG: hexose transporter [Monoraphidium minutum]|nr:MAG: hexose transporter [Monoraphidium minutum]
MGGWASPTPAAAVRAYDAAAAPLTWRAVVVAAVAASAGLLFGIDLGITGGVTSNASFLETFFPHVRAAQAAAAAGAGGPGGMWCQFEDHGLSLFTSSIFLAGAFSSLVAANISRRSRKRTLLIAGGCFLVGAGLCAGAVHKAMLICGRIMLGLGVGLANQAAPVYLSETAPPRWRGAVTILFQLATTFGILLAQVINLFTLRHDYGWRISLAVAGGPALALLLGAAALPETPNCLAARGEGPAARAALERLRGTGEVDAEFDDIMAAARMCGSTRGEWRALFSRRRLPELVVGCGVAAFSQANGINAILFFTPATFSSLGLGAQASLLNAVVVNGTLFLGTFVSLALVDRVGRRPLLLQGSLQMLLCMAGVAAALGVSTQGGTAPLSPPGAVAMLVLTCLFVGGFAWTWGPIGWLLPSECCPLDCRQAGQSLFTTTNFLVAFATTQAFFSELCAMRFYVYLFFAGFIILQLLFVALLVPETRGVPIEQMGALWEGHRVWGRWLAAARGGGAGGGDGKAAAVV